MTSINKNTGFSLIELSIVLVVVGLLIGSMISGFTTYTQNRRIQEAKADLQNIYQALIGFAIQNQRLPCPDVNGPGVLGFGIEDRPGGVCSANAGFLPFADLGISGVVVDPWGSPYAYAVDTAFADSLLSVCPGTNPPNSFGLCNAEFGNIEIKDTGAQGTGNCGLPCINLANNVAAVFYSFGSNGYSLSVGNYSIHEQENIWAGGVTGAPVGAVVGSGNDPNDRVYVNRQYNPGGLNQFDDQIMWIPSSILKAKMVEAGRLP